MEEVALKFNNLVAVEHIRDGKVLSRQTMKNLITNAGKDWLCGIMGSAAGTPAKYIALTSDATAAAATDTTLASEYTLYGLDRKAGTYGHTTAAASFTLTYMWTATADSKVVAKTALFDAAAAGNMFAEVVLGSSVTLMTGDQLQVVWTVATGA